MKLEDLKKDYDRLQLKYGAKELDSIYNGGECINPDISFVFMNPTGRNIASSKNWKGLKSPWIGTKNIWTLFYNVGLLDDDVYKKIKVLSGGEKIRLKLCILMNQNLNLLVLDEPTNHLDLNSREVLEENLMNYSGTLLFVSHDRYFLEKMTNKIWNLENKKMKVFSGNYDEYISRKKNDVVEEQSQILRKNRK